MRDRRMILAAVALLAFGCATVGQFPPGGRVCAPGSDASTDCGCYVFVVPSGWALRDCPPSPPPATPTPTPTVTPGTPDPGPTPCTFPCPPGTRAGGDSCRDRKTDGKASWLEECVPDSPPTGCGLPPGAGDGVGCPKGNERFRSQMMAAQAYAISQGTANEGRVLDSARYHAAIVEYLRRLRFCAFFDGEEIALKNSNAFSEQWDVESAGGKPIMLYTAECRPAWSAIPSDPGAGPTPPPASPPPSPCTPSPERVECAGACNDWRARETNRNWFCIDQACELLIEHDHTTMRPWTPDWRPLPWEVTKAPRAVDRQCRVLKMPERTVMKTAAGHDTSPWDGTFEVRNGERRPVGYLGDIGCTVVPAATCSPTPAPPSPPPGQNDARDDCPALGELKLTLHNVQGPDHLPRPHPVVGGYLVIDSTMHFGCMPGGCFSQHVCNVEHHNPCTRSGRAHVHNAPEGQRCTAFRPCEDTRGSCWAQSRGPFVDGRAQNPGDAGRGHQYRMGPFREEGTYRVGAWAGTAGCPWVDGLGQAVAGEASGEVTFTVGRE